MTIGNCRYLTEIHGFGHSVDLDCTVVTNVGLTEDEGLTGKMALLTVEVSDSLPRFGQIRALAFGHYL